MTGSNNFTFFIGIIRNDVFLDEIFQEYLDTKPVGEIESSRYYRSRMGRYMKDKEYDEYKTKALQNEEFIGFFYSRVEIEKNEAKLSISSALLNTHLLSSKLEYLITQMHDVFSLLQLYEENKLIEKYSQYLISSLVDVGVHCIKLCENIPGDNKSYQRYYKYFSVKEEFYDDPDIMHESNELDVVENDNLATFQKSTKKNIDTAIFQSWILKLFTILKDKKYIDESTKYERFLRIFGLGDKKLSEIVWRKQNITLQILINFLYDNNIVHQSKRIWYITGNCFIGINEEGEIVSFKPIGSKTKDGKSNIYGKYNPIGGAKAIVDMKDIENLLINFKAEIEIE